MVVWREQSSAIPDGQNRLEVVSEPGSHDAAQLQIEQVLRLPLDPTRNIIAVLPDVGAALLCIWVNG
jgi:hypothetical protein